MKIKYETRENKEGERSDQEEIEEKLKKKK